MKEEVELSNNTSSLSKKGSSSEKIAAIPHAKHTHFMLEIVIVMVNRVTLLKVMCRWHRVELFPKKFYIRIVTCLSRVMLKWLELGSSKKK